MWVSKGYDHAWVGQGQEYGLVPVFKFSL